MLGNFFTYLAQLFKEFIAQALLFGQGFWFGFGCSLFFFLALFVTGGFHQLHRSALEQHFVTGRREPQHAVGIVGNFQIAQVDQLHEVLLPIPLRQIAASAISFDGIITQLTDFFAARSPQHVNEHPHRHLFIDAVNGRQGFLGNLGTVDVLGRVATNVTVATVVAQIFAKIGQEDAAPAG